MVHFHIYTNAEELDILEEMLDENKLLCIKSKSVIITEHSDKMLRVLAEFIINHLYKNYIQNRLRKMYSYFSVEERCTITGQVICALENDDIAKLLKKIRFGINLHSFVYFCMGDELSKLNEEIDCACELMHAKKEYYEYIHLLKYYVSMHDSKYDEVNLIFFHGGFDITNGSFKSLCGDVKAELSMLDGDDSIITALIDIAPEKIMVHNAHLADDEVMDTLTDVFSDKLTLCRGCEKCKSQRRL